MVSSAPPIGTARPAFAARAHHGTWVARVALVGYFELLVVLALSGYRPDPPGLASLLDGARDLTRLVWSLGVFAASEAGRFAPLGLLAALAMPRRSPRRNRTIGVGLLGGAFALALALVLAVAVRSVEIGWPGPGPGATDVALPVAGCAAGVGIGMTWLRGPRARRLLVPTLALPPVIGAAGLALLVVCAVEDSPISFDAPRLTSADKRRLYYLIESKDPRKVAFGQTQTLRLAEQDLDLLLAWGLGLGAPAGKAKTELRPHEATILISARIGGGRRPRYMNLSARGTIAIQDGRLHMRGESFRLGRLAIPRLLLRAISPLASAMVSHDRRLRPLISSVRRLEMGPAGVELTYGRADLPPGLVSEIFRGEGSTDDVLPAVRAQVRHLLHVAERLPLGEARVGGAVGAAFALSRARSGTSLASLENRAAILSLGVLLGHWRVGALVGPVVDAESFPRAANAFRGTTMRGREDWTRHFFVSAALALVSTENVSTEAGLFKEELDADQGGSGFSFADLLADRAGTAFALAATRDENAARAMQVRLSRAFTVSDFFPPAADLPEGLADAELQSRYGGVGGEGYRLLVADIERRVAASAGYAESDATAVTPAPTGP